MHILFTRFPLESTYGGAEIQTMSLMRGLIERGHTVSFVGSCPTLLAHCTKEKIPTQEVHIGPPPVTKWGVVSFAWRKRRMAKTLRTIIDGYKKVDVVCMLSMSEKLLATAYAAGTGKRVVWIEHDSVGPWLTRNPWLMRLRSQSHHALTVPVSHMTGRAYIHLGWNPRAIRPIPNGIEEKRVHDNKAVKHEKYVVGRLLCVARLVEEKGIDVLIRAIADTPTFLLDIVGVGPHEDYLRRMVIARDLEKRVTFKGRIESMRNLYGHYDALVLPSRTNDPFGLVVAEAMMEGLPTIVTDACGIAEYVNDGHDAIIAHANSISAMKHALERLVETAHVIRKNAKKTAQEKFSIKRMVTEYESLFTETSFPR